MWKKQISIRTSLITVTAFLTCLGLLAIYASSSIPANQLYGDQFLFVRKQIIISGLGFFIIFILGHTPFKWIERLTLPIIIISIILLVLVHVPGLEGKAGGASRWIRIKGFTFQPGELAKLALILFLAKNLSRKSFYINNLQKGIIPNISIFLIFGGLLMIQPDLGTTALLLVITLSMFFVSGISRKYIYILSGLSISAFIIAVVSAPYRMKRLFVFLNPWTKFKTGGFQIIQSYLGFQNGGLLGAGLGESRQKLFFLPDAHTDFILSVIGEELGLIGILLVIILFTYLVFLGYKITKAQTISYRKFLAFGITGLIAMQALLNMGVTMGMLPTKGIPLPFVSQGASSLLVFLISIAILARISQEIPSQDETLTASS